MIAYVAALGTPLRGGGGVPPFIPQAFGDSVPPSDFRSRRISQGDWGTEFPSEPNGRSGSRRRHHGRGVKGRSPSPRSGGPSAATQAIMIACARRNMFRLGNPRMRGFPPNKLAADLAVADLRELVGGEGLDHVFLLPVDLQQVIVGPALMIVLVDDQVAIRNIWPLLHRERFEG